MVIKTARCLLKYTVPINRKNARTLGFYSQTTFVLDTLSFFPPDINPVCWKKLLKKKAFPTDLKCEIKSHPVHMYSVGMMDTTTNHLSTMVLCVSKQA